MVQVDVVDEVEVFDWSCPFCYMNIITITKDCDNNGNIKIKLINTCIFILFIKH